MRPWVPGVLQALLGAGGPSPQPSQAGAPLPRPPQEPGTALEASVKLTHEYVFIIEPQPIRPEPACSWSRRVSVPGSQGASVHV